MGEYNLERIEINSSNYDKSPSISEFNNFCDLSELIVKRNVKT
jgi:hypothetical protein